MTALKNLEPKGVFGYFEEICSIPHGSGNVKQISNYFVEFAKKHNLEYYQDELYNVIIIGEATAGYEAEEPIILQGHMDMVAVKRSDCNIDMEKEGLKLMVEGDEIFAIGTSLGGDNGIAAAYALAILADKSIKHPRLEIILTVDEETGMTGARGIDLSMLQGHRMVNLDSEEEGNFYVGCAGGAKVKCSLPIIRKEESGICYEVTVSGLNGGHSGCEIDKERGNAICLLARMLQYISKRTEISIVDMEGGLADNAIPREAKAKILIQKCQEDLFIKILKDFDKDLKKEYIVKDKGIYLEINKIGEEKHQVITKESGRNIIMFLFLQPNGVQSMSADIKGLVQTSLNIGIMKLTEYTLETETSVRSSIKSEKSLLIEKLQVIAKLVGANMHIDGDYPGWEFRQHSPLRDKMIEVYRKMYHKEPKVYAIHAGLECGLLAEKIKDLDCVSIGPNMKDIHTTEESLSISSAKRIWEYLLEVLAEK